MGDFQPFVLSAEMLGHEGPVSQCAREREEIYAQFGLSNAVFLPTGFHLLSFPPCSLDVLPLALPCQRVVGALSSQR